MQKCTMSTFADMKKALPNDKDRKLIIDSEVLFRPLLAVSKSRDVDLRKVLQYELAAVPPSLFHHGDGTMRKTNNADLAKKLESNCPDVLTEVPQIPTSTSSTYIIVGVAMVQSLNENHFRTFKDFAEVVQKPTVRLLSNPSFELSCVTIVFDRYDNGSLTKATERERRGSSALVPTYQIQGSRKVPNYCKFLKGAGNKASLANYISLYILEHATEYIPNGKSIILAGGLNEGMLVKEATPSGVSTIKILYSNQEEADTRMIIHASSLSRDHERIIIQCDDTDVLVLLV